MDDNTNNSLYHLIDKIVDNLVKQFFANEISLETAVSLARQRCEIAQKIDKKLVGKIHNLISIFYFEHGRYDDALQYIISAQDAFKMANHAEGIASSFNNIGEIHRIQAHYEKAITNYQVARQIALEHNLSTQYAFSISNEASANLESGNFEQAQQLYNECLKFARENPDTWDVEFANHLLPEIYTSMAQIFANLHEFDEARNYVQRAIAIGKQTDNLAIAGTTAYTNLHICFHSHVSTQDALHFYEESFLAFSQMQAQHQLVDVYLLWAKYCERENHLQDAVVAYQSAINILAKLQLAERLAKVQQILHKLNA